MENQTTFDLNHAIQRWRENLGQSPAFRSENLNELESHLRDSIATLQARGLSEEEGFLIASRRIGGSGQLEGEFGKINGHPVWLDRIFWVLIGVQVWSIGSMLFKSVSVTAFAFRLKALNYNYKASGWVLPVTVFAVAQLVMMALGVWFCWRLIVRRSRRLTGPGKVWRAGRFGFPVTCAGLCLLIYLAYALGGYCRLVAYRFLSLDLIGGAATAQSYAQVITGAIQIVVMVIVTMLLARKRMQKRIAEA